MLTRDVDTQATPHFARRPLLRSDGSGSDSVQYHTDLRGARAPCAPSPASAAYEEGRIRNIWLTSLAPRLY